MTSYEKFTGIIVYGIGVSFLVLLVLIFLDIGLLPVFIVAAVFIAAVFFAYLKQSAMFPQWKGLRWRIPRAMILSLVGVFIGLLLAEILLDMDASLVTIGLFYGGLLSPLQYYRNAKKYHMDELASIEELREKYPECEKDLVVII